MKVCNCKLETGFSNNMEFYCYNMDNTTTYNVFDGIVLLHKILPIIPFCLKIH